LVPKKESCGEEGGERVPKKKKLSNALGGQGEREKPESATRKLSTN